MTIQEVRVIPSIGPADALEVVMFLIVINGLIISAINLGRALDDRRALRRAGANGPKEHLAASNIGASIVRAVVQLLLLTIVLSLMARVSIDMSLPRILNVATVGLVSLCTLVGELWAWRRRRGLEKML